MKEIFSAFGSEIFRPLATIVIPGAMAMSAWFIVLLQRFPSFRNLAEANHTETALLLALASVASGLLVEDIGSRIESRLFDKKLVKKSEFFQHGADWNQYLRLAFTIEPVGQRYLRTILLRFKFEVGTAVALLFSCPGLFWTGLAGPWAMLWFSVCVVTALGLLFEASCSHKVLSEIRHEILKGAIVYPAVVPAGSLASSENSSLSESPRH
jgi:hypothetical protein